jgi:YidC/Oxa1 family membrane protein insertase
VNNDAWYSPVIDAFAAVLTWLHDLVANVGFLEPHAWGWAIILLTLVVRVFLLPLAIKQTRSMRAMQKLQPQLKELQKKYKVDRALLKKDPEQYKAKKQKLNEEMMALYQREGANPAASCLPLLAQAPIFIALFWTLNWMDELSGAEFYFFTEVGTGGLEQSVSGAGWPGWLLIALMSGSMFLAQKQMMARNPMQAEGPMAQQQKIMLYAMPVFLAFISFRFPMGILLYWVTTNMWQVAQQAIILREVKHELEEERQSDGGGTSRSATSGGGPVNGHGSATSGKGTGGKGKAGKGTGGKGKDPSATPPGQQSGRDGKKDGPKRDSKGSARSTGGAKKNESAGSGKSGAAKKRDHIPRRGNR